LDSCRGGVAMFYLTKTMKKISIKQIIVVSDQNQSDWPNLLKQKLLFGTRIDELIENNPFYVISTIPASVYHVILNQ